jgi:glutathionylspermidine synthase
VVPVLASRHVRHDVIDTGGSTVINQIKEKLHHNKTIFSRAAGESTVINQIKEKLHHNKTVFTNADEITQQYETDHQNKKKNSCFL